MKNYYVSHQRGHEDNTGTEESPFASIEQARDHLRSVSDSIHSDITVWIEGGLYELNAPLALGPMDSGKNGHTITYKAMDGQQVLVSGGRKVREWETVKDSPILRAKVPENVGDFVGQFYASGKLKPIASSGFRFNLLPRGGEAFRTEKRLLAPASIFEGVEDPSGLFMDYFLVYIQLKIPIGSVKFENDTAEILIREDFPLHKMLPASSPWTPQVNEEEKFSLVNDRKFLDSPGEWYFDQKEKFLYYYPEAEEEIDSFEAFIGVHEQVMIFGGNDAEERVVNLTLEGITIAHSNYGNPMEFGYLSSHSDYIEFPDEKEQTIPAAILIENAENICIENCELSQFGNTAIGIRRNTQSIRVAQCLIRQVGAGGVSVGYLLRGIENINPDAVYNPAGGYWMDAIYHNENYKSHPDFEFIPCNVVIEDNIIEDVGIDFGTNNGIIVYHAKRARLTHNLIRNIGYCGISVCTDHFWNPEYEEGNDKVGDHLISGNLLVDTCRVLYDGAPIYVLYRNCGENLITRNCILIDRMGERGHNCAVYLDEGCSNYTVSQNVVDVPHNMKLGWLVLNQREPKMPRNLKIYDNHLTNTDCIGKEALFSDTIDGIVDSEKYQIFAHDNNFRRNDLEWSKEAQQVILESGPRKVAVPGYQEIIETYLERLLEKSHPGIPSYYESYRFTTANNRIANGDFEQGMSHPWTAMGCFVQVRDTDSYEGRNCLEVTNRKFPFSGPKMVFDCTIVGDLEPGGYRISFAAKAMGEVEMRPTINIVTKDGEQFNAGVTMPAIKPKDGWVYLSEDIEISWEGEIRNVQFLVGTTEESPDRLAGFYLDKVELSKIG